MAVSAGLWRHLRAHQVYGANTDVGKTIVSTILCRAAGISRNSAAGAVAEQKLKALGLVGFLKPVSTGALDDADNEHIKKYAPGTLTGCLHQFDEPVSPHMAAQLKGSKVPSDHDIASSVHKALSDWGKRGVNFALVETAGGVHSPGPNGTSQADLYRPLRLPVVLVADFRLGGISSSISSYESLVLRGYDVESVLLFQDDYYKNHDYLRDYFKKKSIPLVPLPCPPPKPASGEEAEARLRDQENMHNYYEHVSKQTDVSAIIDELNWMHAKKLKDLEEMPNEAHKLIWYPFTQHHGIKSKDITPIDSAYGDYFQTYNKEAAEEGHLQPSFDGSASWWTQGLGHGNPSLSLSAAYAAGRYGHVMFPGNIHEPALSLAQTLIEGLGNPRLGKVFYSDDGSTGMEVAVKMGLRAAVDRYGWDASQEQINILGLKGSYHGDTIGVMDCAEPSIYNKKVEWYRGRGLWLDFPQVFMSEGVWKVIVPDGLGKLSGSSLEFESLSQVFDVQGRLNSDTAQQYRQIIYDAIEEAIQQKNMKFGALVMEPIILGAGGMFLCDPLFQRCFVDVVRSNPKLFSDTASTEQAPNKWSGLPVIFDEVFTGLYRLGRKSAGSFLKVDPDVVVNAKLLTGGLVPLCTTAASNEIFEVFSTPDKTDALLHGHSYTAHPLGCQVAVDSMKTMSIMEERGDWDAQRRDWGQQPFALSQDAKKPHEQKSTDVWSVWSKDFVSDLSYGKHVDGVFSIGTVLAIHLKDSEGKGYASNAARGFQGKLMENNDHGFNVHARVLGNVLYFMASITSEVKDLRIIEELVRKTIL